MNRYSNKYCHTIMSFLGEGSYSVVTKDHEHNIAIKKFKDPHDPNAIQEICILKYLQHKNIINIASVTVDPNGMFEISMKLYSFDLSRDWRKLSDRTCNHIDTLCCIADDIANGIAYMHSHLVIHCDIKPHNILYDKASHVAVITDMNLATFDPKSPMSTRVQTSTYRAPEVDFSKKLCHYDYAIDIWSIGCVMYYLLTNERFIKSNSDDSSVTMCEAMGLPEYKNRAERMLVLKTCTHQQLKKIITAKVSETNWKHINNVHEIPCIHLLEFSVHFINIITSTLMPIAKQRYDSSDLCNAMTMLTKFHKKPQQTLTQTQVPIHMHTLGTEEFMCGLYSEIVEFGHVNMTEAAPRIAIMNKIYSHKNTMKTWMQMTEIKYYKKLSSKKIVGSAEDLIVVAAISYIISCIKGIHDYTLYKDNNISTYDLHKQAIIILKTLNYELI